MVRKHSSAVHPGGRRSMLASTACGISGLDVSPHTSAGCGGRADGLTPPVAWGLLASPRLDLGRSSASWRAGSSAASSGAASTARREPGADGPPVRRRRHAPPTLAGARCQGGTGSAPAADRATSKPRPRRPTPTTSASRSGSAPRTAATPCSIRRRWGRFAAGGRARRASTSTSCRAPPTSHLHRARGAVRLRA